MRYTRRDFLATAASASVASWAASTAFAGGATGTDAAAAATFHRYNVNTPQGQRMLASYARGIQKMLALPADHPHNWFRTPSCT